MSLYGSLASARRALVPLALLLWLFVAIYPFVFVVLSSVRTMDEYLSNPIGLPTDLQWWHFGDAWERMRVSTYLANSLFVSVFTVLGSLLLSSTVAFAFARFEFRFKSMFWAWVMVSLFLPGTTALFPLVSLAKTVGLYGSLWALVIIYSASLVGWNAFFLRSYMETIPRELEAAAIIDGANVWQVYRWIMLPLSIPALATLGVFAFIFTWSDFMLPIMLADSPDQYTVAVGTLFLQVSGRGATDPTLVAAGMLISIIPVVVAYIVLQRYVVAGLTSGALKGA